MANTKKYVSLDKLSLYDGKIKKVITDGDAAALASAKEFATSLGSNYDAAGAAATVQGKLDEEVTRAKAKEDEIAAANAATQGEVDALETLVGTLPEGTTATSVVDYVNKKTEGIATDAALGELNSQVSGLQTAVQGIQADYLTSEDKTELSDLITAEASRADTAEKANAAAIKAISDDYLKGSDKTELQGAIDGVAEDVAEIVGDYLTSEDKTELQGAIDAKAAQTALDAEIERATGVEAGLQTQINTIMNNPDAEGAINSINEFTQYVADHGTIADGFRTDINKNKDDIAAMDTAYKAADTVLSGRLDVLEAIDHDAYVDADTALKNELTGEIDKKADTSALTSAIEALEGADTGLGNRITALETAVGDGGSVDEMIADAIDAERALIDAELEKKVDKVEGKGLSTNDLTNDLKANYDTAYTHSQAAHAPANAQANVIESIKVNGTAQTITGKAVDIAVPTDNAQLTNGAGYLVANDIANKADKATTLAGYGIADAYTSAQTDTAIATAIGQFVEVSEEEINQLFQA